MRGKEDRNWSYSEIGVDRFNLLEPFKNFKTQCTLGPRYDPIFLY